MLKVVMHQTCINLPEVNGPVSKVNSIRTNIQQGRSPFYPAAERGQFPEGSADCHDK